MANRYWVGGTDNWNSTAGSKWSTTSGGAGGAANPTSADDVFFDANSGAVTITLSISPTLRSLNCTGFTGTFAQGSNTMVIGTSTPGASNIALKLVSGMTFSGTGEVRMFSTSATQQTIDTGGKTIGQMTMSATGGGNYILAGPITVSNSFSHTTGTFDTGNYDMSIGQLSGSNSAAKTINLGSSTITITGSGTSLTYNTSTNTTLNAGTSTIICQGAGTYIFGNLTWYNVECSMSSPWNVNANTNNNTPIFNDFTYTPAAGGYLRTTSNLQIDGTLTINGASETAKTAVVTYTSQKTITAANISTQYANYQDIIGAGAADWDLSDDTSIGDMGGNTGITFESPTDYYYIGDGDEANLTTSWSTTSGGSAGTVVPKPQDMMIFDANSFSSDSTYWHNLTWSGGIDFSAVDQVIEIETIQNVYFYGDVILKSNMLGSGSEFLYFEKDGTQNFDPQGSAMTHYFIFGKNGRAGNTIELLSNFFSENAMGLRYTNFNTNDYDITVKRYSEATNTTANMTLGSSTLEITSTEAGNIFGETLGNGTWSRGTSTLLFSGASTSSQNIMLSSRSYYNVDFITTGRTGSITLNDTGSISISNRLSIYDTTTAYTFLIRAGKTIALESSATVDIKGISGSHDLTLDSTTSTNATISKASGIIVVYDVVMSDITATGGATFYAADSTNGGDNPGWIFSFPEYDGSITMSGDSSLSIGSPTLESFSSVVIEGSSTFESLGTTRQVTSITMEGTSSITSVGYIITEIVEVDKHYTYKVYDLDGNFVGQWNDVVSELSISREINSAGSSVDVILARNSDTKEPSLGDLQDESEDAITTQNDLIINTTEQLTDSIGPGSNVVLNYDVDIYIYYGSYGELATEDSDTLITEDDDLIQGQQGTPDGSIIFQGYISKYTSKYGGDEKTVVTLSSYGAELDNYLIEYLGYTQLDWLSEDPSDILRDIIDIYTGQGGIVSYDSTTIDDTNTVVSYTFNTATTLEGIKKSLELAPSDWFWFLDMRQNLIHFHNRPSVPDHTFVLGKHIMELNVEQYIDDITNVIYFSGGEVSPGVNLYKKYTDPTSETLYRRGMIKYSDNRVILEDSADIIAQSELERNSTPRYRSTVIIVDRVYDIETIELGDLIAFRNFDNYVDELEMQVVGIDYNPNSVQLQLDTLLPRVSKRLEDIKRNLNKQETLANPDTPTT